MTTTTTTTTFLLLSRNSPKNTIIRNERGSIVYKIETPRWKWIGGAGKVTTIWKAPVGGEEPREFIRVASIDWTLPGAPQLTFGGFRGDMRTFMPYGGRKQPYRVFVASDQRAYKWGLKKFELEASDTPGLLVAKFHQQRGLFAMFRKPPPATLEVRPLGDDIMDEIVTTWVYAAVLWKGGARGGGADEDGRSGGAGDEAGERGGGGGGGGAAV